MNKQIKKQIFINNLGKFFLRIALGVALGFALWRSALKNEDELGIVYFIVSCVFFFILSTILYLIKCFKELKKLNKEGENK